MAEEEDPLSKFTSAFNVLSHSLRVSITKILYEKGPTSFSGLMKELNIDPGKLGFHLRHMEEIVTQDVNNNYCLSDHGSIATKVLQSVGLVNTKAPNEEKKPKEANLGDVIKSIRMAGWSLHKKPGEVSKWVGGFLAVIGLFLYIISPQLYYTVIIVGFGVMSICVGTWFDYKKVSVITELVRSLRETGKAT